MDHSGEHNFTVEKWLKAKLPLLGQDGIESILAEWGIQPGISPSFLTARERDLMLAQGYFDMVMMCSSSAAVTDTDGNWSHSEGSRNISDADKQLWRNLHARLRKKWGEEPLFKPSVKISSRGFKTWRKV